VLRLDGVNDRISLGSDYTQWTGREKSQMPLSLHCWVKMDNINYSAGEWFWGGATSTTWVIAFGTYIGKLRLELTGRGVDVSSGTIFTTAHNNEWQWVGYTIDATQGSGGQLVQFWLNGAKSGSAISTIDDGADWTQATIDANAEQERWIGKDRTAAFKGIMDEFFIYNRVLTDPEMIKNYKHGKGKHK
tara:strand:+ start:476 stop:1042 length:567 start_codon:yes stop_codon:yes gene_type:complete